MLASQSQDALPYHAQRILAKYEPAFRARLEHYLLSINRSDTLTMDAISGAVSKVFSELTAQQGPRFSPELQAQAMEAFRTGDALSTKEWVDELRGQMA